MPLCSFSSFLLTHRIIRTPLFHVRNSPLTLRSPFHTLPPSFLHHPFSSCHSSLGSCLIPSFFHTFNSVRLLLDCKLMEKRKQPPTPTANDTQSKRPRPFQQGHHDTLPRHFQYDTSMSTTHSYHTSHLFTPWLPLVTKSASFHHLIRLNPFCSCVPWTSRSRMAQLTKNSSPSINRSLVHKIPTEQPHLSRLQQSPYLIPRHDYKATQPQSTPAHSVPQAGASPPLEPTKAFVPYHTLNVVFYFWPLFRISVC